MPQATAPQPTAQTNPAVQRQIDRAEELEGERGAVAQDIAANRDYLRLMAANGELSPEQKSWLEDFYPNKAKGDTRSDEQISRTRELKAAARKKHQS